ncbi:MAG TPA: type II toxin-antitoxin system RelE/ParE family toxin [Ktedonobacterales bacterium]
MTTQWTIQLTQTATDTLHQIKDQRTLRKIVTRIQGLTNEPDKQGKPLTGALAGYRSLRAAGQRYRIIYQLDNGTIIVYVVLIGLRKEGSKADIYELAQRLVRLGLLDPETP